MIACCLLLTCSFAIGLAVIDIYCLPGNVEQIQKLYERVDQGTYGLDCAVQ